jgi:hypothetical protein
MSSLRHARYQIVKLGESSTAPYRFEGRRALSSGQREADKDVSNQLRQVMRNVPQVSFRLRRFSIQANSVACSSSRHSCA